MKCNESYYLNLIFKFFTKEGCLFEEVKSTAIKKFNLVPPRK